MQNKKDYVGPDRRRQIRGEMGIVITGSKLPMVTMLTLFGTLITSIVFGTVWLTKLDNRVLENSNKISEGVATRRENLKAIQGIQENIAKTAVILENISEKIDDYGVYAEKRIDRIEERFNNHLSKTK